MSFVNLVLSKGWDYLAVLSPGYPHCSPSREKHWKVQHSLILLFQKLVVKPDQLIKRRGKLGLIKAGTDLAGVKDWLTNKLGKEFKVQYGSWFDKTFSPEFGRDFQAFVDSTRKAQGIVCLRDQLIDNYIMLSVYASLRYTGHVMNQRLIGFGTQFLPQCKTYGRTPVWPHVPHFSWLCRSI